MKVVLGKMLWNWLTPIGPVQRPVQPALSPLIYSTILNSSYTEGDSPLGLNLPPHLPLHSLLFPTSVNQPGLFLNTNSDIQQKLSTPIPHTKTTQLSIIFPDRWGTNPNQMCPVPFFTHTNIHIQSQNSSQVKLGWRLVK